MKEEVLISVLFKKDKLAVVAISIGNCHNINWQLSQYQLEIATISIGSCHNISYV